MNITTFTAVAGNERCNVRCPFCVATMTKHYTNTSLNIINFKAAAKYALMSGAKTFLITGKGEPTLDPDTITKMILLVKDDFPIIEIQTNGLTLPGLHDYLPIWRSNGLKTIAISCVHWDAEKNMLMNPRDRTGMPHLPDLISIVHSYGINVRLSIIMVKGLIDNPEILEEFIGWAKEHRVEQMTFIPVTRPDDVDGKVSKWVKENSVPHSLIGECYQRLQEIGTQVLVLPHGAVVFDVDGQNVCMSNCLTPPTNTDLRQLIYHQDGHVRFDWKLGAILF